MSDFKPVTLNPGTIKVRVEYDISIGADALVLSGMTHGCGCCTYGEEVSDMNEMLATLQHNAQVLFGQATRLARIRSTLVKYGYGPCFFALNTAQHLASLLRGKLENGEQLELASELYSRLGTAEKRILSKLAPELLDEIAKANWPVSEDFQA